MRKVLRCDNCNAEYEAGTGHAIFSFSPDGDTSTRACSLHCLTDLTWKLRESQPKLSKSKQDPA